MVSHEIETYGGFNVRMTLEETPTHWVCKIAFGKRDEKRHKAVPPEYEEYAEKSKMGALRFSIAMQSKARTLIDDWLAQREGWLSQPPSR
jgi:hypothetical protein